MAVKNTSHHHQVTFDFSIKSVIPGSSEELLLIETANTEKKEQTLLLLSLKKMEVLQAIAFGLEYSGMVVKSYDAEQLLLIQYSNQNNPDQTNIYRFSWTGGDPTFSLANTRIIKSGTDWIQVPHPHFVGKDMYIDLTTNQEIRHVPQPREESSPEVFKYATSYPDSSEYFEWFKQYFSKYDIQPQRQIEYLKLDLHILISFYQEVQGTLSHYLAVINSRGELLERILLDEDLNGIGRDNFFVLRNKAIFVTQKRTLNIYDL